MKVVAPGAFLFASNGYTTVTGWALDTEGKGYDQNSETDQREVTRAVLLHIAAVKGVNLCGNDVQSDVAPSIEVERATLDAVAAMRWGPAA